MTEVRGRSSSLAIFRLRAEELLDNELLAKIVYGIYATISFALFILALVLPTPLRTLCGWMIRCLWYIFGRDSVYMILVYVFLIFFVPFAHYCVGAYGPGVLRILLFHILVKRKLDRIYRENHDEVSQADFSVDGRVRLWSPLRRSCLMTLGLLREKIRGAIGRRNRIMLPAEFDNEVDALSLHDVPFSEE